MTSTFLNAWTYMCLNFRKPRICCWQRRGVEVQVGREGIYPVTCIFTYFLQLFFRSSKTSLASRKSRRPSRQMSASSRYEHITDLVLQVSLVISKLFKPCDFQAILHLWATSSWPSKQAKEAKTFRGSLCWIGPRPGHFYFKQEIKTNFL